MIPLLALSIFAVDQIAKWLIVTHIRPFDAVQPIPALAYLFNLTFITNTGAAYGLFPDRSLAFVIIAVLVSVGIVLYLRHIPQDEWLLKISLAMQLGGALGNLVDRVRLGYVVDFADFRMWPVFNFADTFIVVGVLLLAYCLLLRPERTPPSPSPQLPARPDDSMVQE
jgi:signal peptidase II